MDRTFIKYLLFGFLGTLPLNYLLFMTFDILTKLGVPNNSNRVALFFAVYIIEIPLYILVAYLYLRMRSKENLEKLKEDIKEVTGKKLQ
jgi:hypothetical protein